MDIDIVDDDGKTALMHAIINGHKQLMGELINLGASLQLQDKNKNSALTYAAERKLDLMNLSALMVNTIVLLHRFQYI